MDNEINVLEKNNTWELTTLPKGKKAIGSKCVYKIKYKADSNFERYKARLVGNDYTRVEGEDYHNTFSLVAKLYTSRILIALAAARGWPLY